MNSSSPDSPFLMLLSIAITRPSWKLLMCSIEVWPTTMRFTPSACTSAATAAPSSSPLK